MVLKTEFGFSMAAIFLLSLFGSWKQQRSEREELLQQLKEKDVMIEFLEHRVIDDPNDAWTSLVSYDITVLRSCPANRDTLSKDPSVKSS